MSERLAPSVGTFYVSLPDLDRGPGGELVHPPERVLEVCVVNDVTCLSIRKYSEEGGRTSTLTTVADVTVDTQSLLAALVSQLDGDVAEASLWMRRFRPEVEGDRG